jgi:hypothetical protein
MLMVIPPCGVARILPEYEPAANPCGFTDTVTCAGAVPLAGLTESQVPPDAADAVRRKEVEAEELFRVTDCEGAAPFKGAENASEEGAADRVTYPLGVTSMVTPKLAGAPEAGVTEMVPLYMPTGMPVGSAVTVNCAGVVPEVGVTDNQVAEVRLPSTYVRMTLVLVVNAVAVADDVTEKVAVPTEPFCARVNIWKFGDAVRVAVWAWVYGVAVSPEASSILTRNTLSGVAPAMYEGSTPPMVL